MTRADADVASAPPSVRSELVIEGTHRVRAGRSLADLWHYREVLRSFTSRTIRLKYKQALLGVSWAVLQPLAFLALFVIFFGRLAGVSGGGVPYAAFALSALVPWQFVANGLSFGTNALVQDAALIRKVYFPRELPVLGAVAATLVDLLIGVAVFLAVGPFIGAHLGVALLYIPLVTVTLTISVTALCIPLAALNVYYRDFRYALPLLIQLGLFASPVAYPVSSIPEQWRTLYALLNPFVGSLEGFRRVLALDQAPDWGLLGLSLVSALVVLVVGYRVFKGLEPEFSDVI
ncbi:MAG TPA: ABC transporter permease [Acidimicrobiia bacterium]|nr:ABC transporter permease [Acidimicrobiia bacterium]